MLTGELELPDQEQLETKYKYRFDDVSSFSRVDSVKILRWISQSAVGMLVALILGGEAEEGYGPLTIRMGKRKQCMVLSA